MTIDLAQKQTPEEWQALWRKHDNIDLNPAPPSINEPIPLTCRYGAQFQERMQKELHVAELQKTVLAINQAKVMIQDHYWSWWQLAPKGCRDHLGNRGHRCIYTIWQETYHKLRELELSVVPISTLVVMAPPPAPKPTLAGMLGIATTDE